MQQIHDLELAGGSTRPKNNPPAHDAIAAFARALEDLESAVAAVGEKVAFGQLHQLLTDFSNVWDRATLPERKDLKSRLQARTLPLLLESELFSHCYRKPRGYAGDYLAMDMIWRGRTGEHEDRYRGSTRRGALINALVLDLPNSAANEQRVHILQRHILAHSGRVVASIGSGPMLEAAEALKAGCSQDTVLHLYDQDSEAIAYASDDMLGRYKVPVHVHAGNLSRSILCEPSEPDYDLVYSSGLYDYFKCGSAKRLTGYLWKRVRPGGTLVITNAHPDNPSRVFLEAASNWLMEHKTEAQMRSFAEGLSGVAELQIQRDDHAVYQYLCLKKAR